MCEQAEAMLYQAAPGASLTRTDIAESDILMTDYAERIPVFRANGRELDWPFSLLDLQAFLGEVKAHGS